MTGIARICCDVFGHGTNRGNTGPFKARLCRDTLTSVTKDTDCGCPKTKLLHQCVPVLHESILMTSGTQSQIVQLVLVQFDAEVSVFHTTKTTSINSQITSTTFDLLDSKPSVCASKQPSSKKHGSRVL